MTLSALDGEEDDTSKYNGIGLVQISEMFELYARYMQGLEISLFIPDFSLCQQEEIWDEHRNLEHQ